MDLDELFLETLDDLEARIRPERIEYDVLGAAALLRKLLLGGGGSLVLQANRAPGRRLRVTYLVNLEPLDPKPRAHAVLDGLDPASASTGVPTELSLDAFLTTPVMRLDSTVVTVHDLIDYLAHTAGAVHAGSPTTDADRAIAAFPKVKIHGVSFEVRAIVGIARVVLGGLSPLRQFVATDVAGRAG